MPDDKKVPQHPEPRGNGEEHSDVDDIRADATQVPTAAEDDPASNPLVELVKDSAPVTEDVQGESQSLDVDDLTNPRDRAKQVRMLD